MGLLVILGMTKEWSISHNATAALEDAFFPLCHQSIGVWMLDVIVEQY